MYDLPVWSIHSITSGLILIATIWATTKVRGGFITNLISYVFVTLGVAIVVLGTQAFPMRFG